MEFQEKNKFNTKKLIKYFSVIFIWLFMVIMVPTYALTLKMSFTSQAPFGHWVQPYADACEETSILMVDAYYSKYHLDQVTADYEIRKIIGLKNKFFGRSDDESASQIVKLINDFFPWEAEVVINPSKQQLIAELENGRPIILPVDGKILQNPNYTADIDYHVIVLSGYDFENDEFISQDPGTKNGQNYRYPSTVIMKAIHDFIPGQKISFGPVVAIFTSPSVVKTAKTDGDDDGLFKIDEIKYHTSLLEPDTDRDGFLDGVEIEFGYSPHVAEYKITPGSLVRSAKNHRVYLLGKTEKFHIINQEAFNAKGFVWAQVITVSEKFLSEFNNGQSIK